MRAIYLGIIYFFGLIGALFIISCSAYNPPTDESDLQQVANYYYQPGKSNKLIHSVLHDYLSEKSKKLITFEVWDKSNDANATNDVSMVSLLGPKINADQTYEVVSVKVEIPDKDGKKYRMTYSDTWTLENGKWKRLSFLQAKDDYEKAFQAGDFEAAEARAQDWLVLNPYSIEANQSLDYAIIRAAASHNEVTMAAIQRDEVLGSAPPIGDYSAMVNFYQNLESIGSNEKLLYENLDFSVGSKSDEIVTNMIAINPNDSSTLFCVVNLAQSDELKKNYFLKMKELTTDPDDIFTLASNIRDMHFRFDFLSDEKDTPGVLLLELEAYAVLAESGNSGAWWDLYKKFEVTKAAFENIKPALDNMSSKDSAYWAGQIGELLFNSKDYSYAQQLLNYGNKRDSDEPQIKLLAHDLETVKK